jgi:hypothetical protein
MGLRSIFCGRLQPQHTLLEPDGHGNKVVSRFVVHATHDRGELMGWASSVAGVLLKNSELSTGGEDPSGSFEHVLACGTLLSDIDLNLVLASRRQRIEMPSDVRGSIYPCIDVTKDQGTGKACREGGCNLHVRGKYSSTKRRYPSSAPSKIICTLARSVSGE